MDIITPEIIRNLLDTLVTPKFNDIVDYDIKTNLSDENKVAIGIDVILKHGFNPVKQDEYDIERRIRDVIKYLSPSFTMVEFYVTDDY